MHRPLHAQIAEAEDQLRTAMLSSDVAALNELLTEDLIFTNHLGQLLGKNDDLSAYRSGVLKIVRLEPSEQHRRAAFGQCSRAFEFNSPLTLLSH
jgi:hypothetical protein